MYGRSMANKETVLGLRLDPSLAEAIEGASSNLGISKPDLVRMLITKFLESYDAHGQTMTLPIRVSGSDRGNSQPSGMLIAAESPTVYGTKKRKAT